VNGDLIAVGLIIAVSLGGLLIFVDWLDDYRRDD